MTLLCRASSRATTRCMCTLSGVPGLPAALQIIRHDEHQLVPWKNGQGMTRVVAVREDEETRGWLWRLSIATVDRDGPFSDFAGYNRVIMLLKGAGMTLEFGDFAPAEILDERFRPFAFYGGWPCNAKLLHGEPLTDFNVISAAGRVSTQADVVPVFAEATEATTPLHHSATSMATFFYVLQGTCRVSAAESGESILLSEGDCLHVGDESASARAWSGRAVGLKNGGETLLYRLQFSSPIE